MPMHGALGLESTLNQHRVTQYPILQSDHLLLHLPLLGVRRGKQHLVRFVCTLYLQQDSFDTQLTPRSTPPPDIALSFRTQ